MQSRLKGQLADSGAPVGSWISIGHPAVAEMMAILEFDFVLIDTEHTTTGVETVEQLVRAVDAVEGPTEAVVRVPTTDPGRIKRVLDTGAAGLMIPKVETAADAEAVVDAMRYPPEGHRGIAGERAAKYGRSLTEYVERANESVVAMLQVETEAGVANAQSIAGVEGVDALFVGPADLSGALGVFGQWDAPELEEAMDDILGAGDAAGVPVGTLTVESGDIEHRLDQGFDFLVAGKDTEYVLDGARAAKEAYVAALERR